jgi:hypothetical protein
VSPGDKFGRLTLEKPSERAYHWWCKCECGAPKEARKDHLQTGATKSCGCLLSDFIKETKLRHGGTSDGSSPGLKRTFGIWVQMRGRCSNPGNHAYADYGGRGIRVCPEWDDFSVFVRDMGEAPDGLTIDRLDNDKGYSPDNCRWVTKKQQANNRRSNRLITLNGVTKTISQWAEATGLKAGTIQYRISHGWTAQDALQKEIQR